MAKITREQVVRALSRTSTVSYQHQTNPVKAIIRALVADGIAAIDPDDRVRLTERTPR